MTDIESAVAVCFKPEFATEAVGLRPTGEIVGFPVQAAEAPHRVEDRSILLTPEIVVDGSTSHVGSDREDVGRAIARAKSESATLAEVKAVERAGRVSVDIGPGHGAARAILIGFDGEHVTPVARGENRGRTMVETNAVRSFRSIANWNGAAIHLEEDRPDGERFAVILEGEDGRIVGASVSTR
ncbi:hypothetical protein M2171_002414 [Bradyrhizobium japonicum USDA 38]|uniref:DUF1223 domain-containing protein n=1 Tax=Bradyrhizobium japonicum TaxID=375 RepID=UPI0018AD3630|nr:DUF1223 domain-containing protein [Bradyrhizobium japonicum]MCS3893281.1 hypothetical protein [Bradyrhizobium japonicum USDA 38]MCS3945795.1 hypothetical protein [Bradyrhizobium japonicum]